MKKVIVSTAFLCFSFSLAAQKYITRSGKVSFFSSTPIENIEAINNEVGAVVDWVTGDIVFQVPIKSFKFEKQLMQEHFNESYLESDKFPKAVFKGKINNNDFKKNAAMYKTEVVGLLTIHGVSKEVKIPGTIVIKGDEMTINAVFSVATADYKINIPSVVKGKIAEKIEVTINSVLKQK